MGLGLGTAGSVLGLVVTRTVTERTVAGIARGSGGTAPCGPPPCRAWRRVRVRGVEPAGPQPHARRAARRAVRPLRRWRHGPGRRRGSPWAGLRTGCPGSRRHARAHRPIEHRCRVAEAALWLVRLGHGATRRLPSRSWQGLGFERLRCRWRRTSRQGLSTRADRASRGANAPSHRRADRSREAADRMPGGGRDAPGGQSRGRSGNARMPWPSPSGVSPRCRHSGTGTATAAPLWLPGVWWFDGCRARHRTRPRRRDTAAAHR